MNRTKSIAVFAGIFAIAMTIYGLSGVSASPMMMAAVPQTQESMGMLGHVEYTVLNSNQAVKAYLQTDNVVVYDGIDCAGELIFGTSAGGNCDVAGTFEYIAIGNGTQAATVDNAELERSGAGCAGGAGDEGEQARKLVDPTITVAAAGSDTQVELDVGTDTFKFDQYNAITVTQSGIFNAYITTRAADGSCGTLGTPGTTWEMFAIQDLSGGGVTVSDGDSLAVKWTITIS